MNGIDIKRIYEAPSADDGYRILVDRIWPRGVSKEKAKLDQWIKEVAPSKELRKWFDHDPEKFAEFASRYREELKEKVEALAEIQEEAKKNKVTPFMEPGIPNTIRRWYCKGCCGLRNPANTAQVPKSSPFLHPAPSNAHNEGRRRLAIRRSSSPIFRLPYPGTDEAHGLPC
jgi:uncharacterized protein YeaO (DUF488 family)